VDNAWLVKQKGDELCETIRHLRVVAKMKKDFVDNILQSHVNGRVHPQWHALRSETDEGDSLGTRSGRMSSTKLNLQQIPARDPIYGPEIRKGFVGELGEKFIKNDWASQEPRWVIEFAYKLKLPVSEIFMQKFKEAPETDYHKLTIDLVKSRAQMDLPRPQAKDLSLGSLYGMQRNKMAVRLGVDVNKGDEILKAYHTGVPFVSQLIKMVQDRIEQNGFVRTITGRKRRFKSFEPSDYETKKRYGVNYMVHSEEEAIRLWGNKYQRAFKHKGLNAIIQGSSGDQCKECIVELDRRGITPLMAVHDELNASSGPDDFVAKEMRYVMATQMRTEIPFYVGQDIYDSWGGNRG
jgi:DNA polymerase I-like protein with 3'-5' exonuclease and polymerase domains